MRRHSIILSISVVVCLYFFSLVKHFTKQTFQRFHVNFSKSQRMDPSESPGVFEKVYRVIEVTEEDPGVFQGNSQHQGSFRRFQRMF